MPDTTDTPLRHPCDQRLRPSSQLNRGYSRLVRPNGRAPLRSTRRIATLLIPLDFPLQANNAPTLQEYVFDPAVNKTSTATVIRDTWFALQTTTGIKLQKDDPIEITAPKLDPPEPAVHMTISDIQTDVDFSTLILSGVLPPKFRDQKMTITRVRVQPGGAETAGWVAGGANTELKASAPGADILGQLIAIDTLIKLTGTAAPPPASPPPGVAPPAGPPTQFTRIKEVGVTLQLSSPPSGKSRGER